MGRQPPDLSTVFKTPLTTTRVIPPGRLKNTCRCLAKFDNSQQNYKPTTSTPLGAIRGGTRGFHRHTTLATTTPGNIPCLECLMTNALLTEDFLRKTPDPGLLITSNRRFLTCFGDCIQNLCARYRYYFLSIVLVLC